MFRGREVAHPERGVMLLERLAEELSELAVVEQRLIQDGRNMTRMLALEGGPRRRVRRQRRRPEGRGGGGGGAEARAGDANGSSDGSSATS
ncbi:MAG: translation initiation factor IF-3 C-terminal domain-containing protein [Solirubrobacteraceae bacterium]